MFFIFVLWYNFSRCNIYCKLYERKCFYEVYFDEIIEVVKDIKRINIDALDGIVCWFDELLHEYQYLTGFSDSRINGLCVVLNRQINKLKKRVEL